MFEKTLKKIDEIKKKKAQTSLEILIVMGGLIIIAVIVVTIILASSKSKVAEITTADKQNALIIDTTLFPPNINSVRCNLNEDNTAVDIDLSVIPSVTKDISEYCLVVDGDVTEECTSAALTEFSFATSEVSKGNFKVALVSKNSRDAISSNSVAFSCKVKLPAGGIIITPPGEEETDSCGTTLNFSCPEGYIKVPGSRSLGTCNGDNNGFCVMKWEAKVDFDTDGPSGPATFDGKGDTNDTYLNCTSYIRYWNWYGAQREFIDAWNLDGNSTRLLNSTDINLTDRFYKAPDCDLNRTICDCNLLNPSYTLGVDYNIVSSGEGQPLSRLNQNTAKLLCENIGTGYHLITNDEWMTIVKNIEKQPSNWVGQINTSTLKKGNTCEPTTSGTYNLYNGIADRINSPFYRSNRTSTSPAKLVLNNGESSDYNRSIWDLSGNLVEWIDHIVNPFDGPYVLLPVENWYNYTDIASYNLWDLNKYAPTDPVWSSINGIGRIYLNWTTNRDIAVLRGGGNIYASSNCNVNTGIYYFLAYSQFQGTSSFKYYSPDTQIIYEKYQSPTPGTPYKTWIYRDGYNFSGAYVPIGGHIGFRCAYTPN